MIRCSRRPSTAFVLFKLTTGCSTTANYEGALWSAPIKSQSNYFSYPDKTKVCHQHLDIIEHSVCSVIGDLNSPGTK